MNLVPSRKHGDTVFCAIAMVRGIGYEQAKRDHAEMLPSGPNYQVERVMSSVLSKYFWVREYAFTPGDEVDADWVLTFHSFDRAIAVRDGLFVAVGYDEELGDEVFYCDPLLLNHTPRSEVGSETITKVWLLRNPD